MVKRGARLADFFGGVDVDADAEPPRVVSGGAQEIVVAGVGRMGGHPGGDAPVRRALPLGRERRRSVERAVIGVAKDRPAQRRPRPRLRDGLADAIHVKVVIGHGRHARLNHLDQAKQRAPVNIVRGEVALQRPDKIVKPAANRHVLGQAAEEHHRHVRVRVD